jgi:hypothetical protein
MKRYLLLMPAILTATAAIADAQVTAPSSRADAHAQAAALLSGVRHGSQVGTIAGVVEPSGTRPSADAHAQAATLLSGIRNGSQVRTIARVVEPWGARPSADAHAQAAALLSGSRGSTHLEAERAQGGAFTSGKVP